MKTAMALFLFVFPSLLPAQEQIQKPFRYPTGKHGNGKLEYINGIPVLTVQGTPKEIGDQIGALALKPFAPRAEALMNRYLKRKNLEKAMPWLVTVCKGAAKKFPKAYHIELDAMAKASGINRDYFTIANTIADLLKIGGCATLIVDGKRSRTGNLLFGRNLDYPPLGGLDEVSLVIVYHRKGLRPYATVTFPVLLSGPSAINSYGLSIAVNEITSSADGSPRVDPNGTPTIMGMRQLIEQCTTVKEAEHFLRKNRPTTAASLTICDSKEGAVFEITPKNVVPRRGTNGLCACTNHFRTKPLAVESGCWRYTILEKAQKIPKLGLKEVAAQMHAVNQRTWTIQTMIFEPKALRLHLSIGKGPASARPLTPLNLKPHLKIKP